MKDIQKDMFLKPCFWKQPQITNLSSDAKLFFIGMLGLLDDKGEIFTSLENIQKKLFPLDSFNLEKIRREFEEVELVKFYSESMLKIQEFKRYQGFTPISSNEAMRRFLLGREVYYLDNFREGESDYPNASDYSTIDNLFLETAEGERTEYLSEVIELLQNTQFYK